MSDTTHDEFPDLRPHMAHVETSAQIGDVFAAMAKAQGEIKDADKDAKNDHFRSKYATLAAVYEACRAALAKHGIAHIQVPFNEGGDIGVTTILGVASGQWIKGTFKVQPVKYDAQGAGSVVTYLRRYSLSAMVGVAPADDDGEAAVGRPADKRQEAPRGSGQASDQKPSTDRPARQERAAEGEDRKKIVQGAYDRLNKAIKDALDHQMLNDIETTMSADLEIVREGSKTGFDTIQKRIGEKHAAISGGDVDTGPGDQP